MRVGAVVAVGFGALFALIGLSTIIGSLFDSELNSNGFIAGMLGGLPFLAFGGGLILFGLGLQRKGKLAPPGSSITGPAEGSKMIVGGAFLAIASVLGFAVVIGFLLLLAEGVRQTT